jgi:hypothetical protein
MSYLKFIQIKLKKCIIALIFLLIYIDLLNFKLIHIEYYKKHPLLLRF